MNPLPLILSLIAIALATGCGVEPPGSEVLRLRSAALWIGVSEFAPDERETLHVTLPDDWPIERRREATQGWYHFEVELTAAPEPMAILLKQSRLNVQVWVNDEWIGQVGRFEEPIARNPSAALYYVVPSSIWRVGINRIDVRYATTLGYRGLFGEVWVGPADVISSYATRMRFIGNDQRRAALVLCVVLSAVLFRSAASRRPEVRGDFLLGLGTLMLAGMGSGAFFVETPIPSRIFEWAVGCLICWTPLVFVFALHRIVGIELPKRERLALALFGLTSVAAILVPYDRFSSIFPWWFLVSLVFAGYGLCLVVWGAWRRHISRGLAGGLVVGLLVAATAINDQSASDIRVMIVPLGIAWFVVERFFRSTRELGELNQSLEARVAEREEELAAKHARLIALEQERTISRERERLMRELHDGTGGQLVSALSMARSPNPDPQRLASLLQEALDDLRLTIESLDPDATDLPTVLGLLREPIERRLGEGSVRIEWAVGDAGSGQRLGHEATLHVVRIVQEAVTNVIKHSAASRIRVSTRPEGEGVTLEIRDNGHATRMDRKGGRGARNMRARAAALGGRLELETSQHAGTAVILHLPGVTDSGGVGPERA